MRLVLMRTKRQSDSSERKEQAEVRRLYRWQRDLRKPVPPRYALRHVAQLRAHLTVLDSRN